MANAGIRRSHSYPLLCAVLLFLAGCTDSGDYRVGSQARACPAAVDDLLAEVDQFVPDRMNCGSFNSGDTAAIADALDCLLSRDAGSSTELTVNRCEDCSILSTYVVTSEGDMFHVFREADHFGDDQREVAVERCRDLAAHPTEAIECVEPARLFECTDTLPDAR